MTRQGSPAAQPALVWAGRRLSVWRVVGWVGRWQRRASRVAWLQTAVTSGHRRLLRRLTRVEGNPILGNVVAVWVMGK